MTGLVSGEKAGQIGFLIFLSLMSWEDLRTRRLSPAGLAAGGICGWLVRAWICRSMWQGGLSWTGCLLDGALALSAGGILLAVSFLTGGELGAGDGWFFLAAAPWLGWERLWCLLIGGMILCFVVCGCIVVWGGIKGVNVKKKRLPFIPFLLPPALVLLI